MTRITKKELEEIVCHLAELTNRKYVVGYWNGLPHVYNKNNGELLVAGTTRECKDCVDMFIYGYKMSRMDLIVRKEI